MKSKHYKTAIAVVAFYASLLPFSSAKADQLYYKNGSLAVGVTDNAGNQTTPYYRTDFSTGWTNIVNTPSGVFYYNKNNGSGAFGIVDKGSQHTIIANYAPGTFDTNWTNVVSTPNRIFFYNSTNGSSTVGFLNNVGTFISIKKNPPNSTNTGWTHIVNTPNGILFYNSINGAAAVKFLNATGDLITIKEYLPYSFSTNWTHIVNTPHGILFYNSNSTTNNTVVGVLDTVGNISYYSTTTSWSGWTHIIDTPKGLLFYNNINGSGCVTSVNNNGVLSTFRVFPNGYFLTGWTQIIDTFTLRL